MMNGSTNTVQPHAENTRNVDLNISFIKLLRLLFSRRGLQASSEYQNFISANDTARTNALRSANAMSEPQKCKREKLWATQLAVVCLFIVVFYLIEEVLTLSDYRQIQIHPFDNFQIQIKPWGKGGGWGGGDALEKIIITGCGNCIALASALLFWSLDPPLTFDSVLQCRRLLRKPPAEFPRGCGNRPSLLPSLKLGTIYQLIPHLTNSRNYHILEEVLYLL